MHYATKVFTELWRKISHWNLPFLPSKQFSTNTSAENVVNWPLLFWDRVKLIKINRGRDSAKFFLSDIIIFKLLEVKLKRSEVRIMEDSTDACLIAVFDTMPRLQTQLTNAFAWDWQANQRSWQLENRECFFGEAGFFSITGQVVGCLGFVCLAYRYKRMYTHQMFDL